MNDMGSSSESGFKKKKGIRGHAGMPFVACVGAPGRGGTPVPWTGLLCPPSEELYARRHTGSGDLARSPAAWLLPLLMEACWHLRHPPPCRHVGILSAALFSTGFLSEDTRHLISGALLLGHRQGGFPPKLRPVDSPRRRCMFGCQGVVSFRAVALKSCDSCRVLAHVPLKISLQVQGSQTFCRPNYINLSPLRSRHPRGEGDPVRP